MLFGSGPRFLMHIWLVWGSGFGFPCNSSTISVEYLHPRDSVSFWTRKEESLAWWGVGGRHSQSTDFSRPPLLCQAPVCCHFNLITGIAGDSRCMIGTWLAYFFCKIVFLPALRVYILADKLYVLHAYNPSVLGGLR